HRPIAIERLDTAYGDRRAFVLNIFTEAETIKIPQRTFDRRLGGGGDQIGVRLTNGIRPWQFLSRTQCLLCHNNQSEYALAFLPEQLNRLGADGRNQLVSLTEGGYIHRAGKDGKPLPPFDAASAAREPRVGDPADAAQPLEARARGYLHANCGHCHFEHGGGTVALRLQFSAPSAEMKAIGVRPTRGDFGLP